MKNIEAKETYLYNPDLPFVKEDFAGNLFKNGRFYNEVKRAQPKFADIFKWQTGNRPQKEEKKKDRFQLPFLPIDKNIFQTKEDVIIWLGHASFFIRINGVTLLTDPCLGNVALLQRKVKLPCKIADIQGVDYILLSHGHRDHLDIPSLKKVTRHNPKAQFLLPLKTTSIVRKAAKNLCQEAAWYQQFALSDAHADKVKITYLPAVHWNRRGLTDYNQTLWGSFWIQAGEQSIYFAGDTAVGPHFKAIRETMGTPNIGIMPIGAYKPPVIMKGSHVNPTEAVEAFNELQGKIFIPMHYGTFDLSDEPPGEPLREVQRLKKEQILKGELKALAVGEIFRF